MPRRATDNTPNLLPEKPDNLCDTILTKELCDTAKTKSPKYNQFN